MGRFRHRVTGEVRADLPTVVLAGEWEVLRPEGLRINGCLPTAGDVICVDRHGKWTVALEDGSQWSGTLSPAALPSEQVVANLRADDLAEAAQLPRPAEEWLKCPPIALNLLRKQQLSARERQLLRDRGALEHVCRQPRTYLRRELERSLTGRARRLAPRAAEFLAGHPEDWERRQVGAVIPRRVLSQVLEEEWHTYENRVAARLVDRLRTVLAHRERELTASLEMLRELARIAEFDDGMNHRKWARICLLLGQAEDPRNGFLVVERLRNALSGVLLRIRGLEDSTLYQRVPRRATITGALRQTNVLTNDQYYSKIARLWRLFSANTEERPLTGEEFYREQQLQHQHYEAFCTLVLVWALRDLGYIAVDGLVPERGRSTQFRHVAGASLWIDWDSNGFDVRNAAGERFRLVALPHALAAEALTEEVPAAHHLLVAYRVVDDVPTAVLYPGTIAERRVLQGPMSDLLQQAAATSPTALAGRFRLIGVSPLEVDSVERVSRVVRWWLLDGEFLAFPPTLECTADPTPVAANHPALLRIVGRRELRLERWPTSAEWSTIAAAMPALPEQGRRAARAPVPEPVVRPASIATARALLERLSRCPVCERAVDPARSVRSGADGFFRGTCPDCSTIWGAQECGACHKRYSIIAPGGHVRRQHDLGPEWVDLQYGRDVLAEPCRSSDDLEFICPNCRRCPRQGSQSCARCELAITQPQDDEVSE